MLHDRGLIKASCVTCMKDFKNSTNERQKSFRIAVAVNHISRFHYLYFHYSFAV